MVRMRSLLAGLAIACLVLITLPTSASAAPDLRPSQFKGVNWADPRDNFVDGPVIPSGLSTSDDYQTTYRKAAQILDGFRTNLGANTVRLPVNPYSVGTTWWDSYRAVVDAATDHGFLVILSYWEGTGANKDGYVDDLGAWWSMWDTLVNTYAGNRHVYFEPMNEPHGYTAADWVGLVSQWLDRYPAIPRNRVFVDGNGYADHLSDVCSAAALDGTYLALHDYGFWATHTYSDWLSDFSNRIAGCQSRAVLDEFGAPMTTGYDYSELPTAAPTAGESNSVAFMQAATDTVRKLQMGSVYWPGLRNGDSYSMEILTGSAAKPTVANTNESGRALLEWGWGRGHVPPHPPE